MTIRTVTNGRACEHCELPLVRKQHADGRYEHSFKFKARRFCDPVCAIRGRATGPRGHGEQIRWEPIIADPPTEDRCWAGFVAGCRCVLARGGHITHRDAEGREFVGIQRHPVTVRDDTNR